MEMVPQSVTRAIAQVERAKAEWPDKPERLQAYIKKLQKLRDSGVAQLKGATAADRELIQAGIRAIDGYLGQ